MPITGESKLPTLERVTFSHLKGINDLEISFGGKEVTAIFGVNGCGKSTILHALACLYRPNSCAGEKNYFTRFFKKENLETWEGSKLSAHFLCGDNTSERRYEKARDRWTPRISKRPQRDVVYVGINSCVPDIEQMTIALSTCVMEADEEVELQQKIVKSASKIMNYNYESYKKASFRKKKFKKISRDTTLNYSSLTMGAGEQRLFLLLEVLYSLPHHSLLLIDELDLTLHTSALMRLVDEMVEIAKHKQLQIVFTTHREELCKRGDINIRHIWKPNDSNKTFVLNNTTPECLQRLTGTLEKRLEIYVEDDLAEYIAKEVVRKSGLLPHTSFHRFGAAENAFVVAAGLDIQGVNDAGNRIILLDGDKYRTENERMEQMERVYSGTENDKKARRQRALSRIKQYILPEGEHPEHFLWGKLKEVNNEYSQFAREISGGARDNHDYLNEVQRRSGETRSDFLGRLITSLAQQEFWDAYVKELIEWITSRKSALGIS